MRIDSFRFVSSEAILIRSSQLVNDGLSISHNSLDGTLYGILRRLIPQ